jgi:hypothetical protein
VNDWKRVTTSEFVEESVAVRCGVSERVEASVFTLESLTVLTAGVFDLVAASMLTEASDIVRDP